MSEIEAAGLNVNPSCSVLNYVCTSEVTSERKGIYLIVVNRGEKRKGVSLKGERFQCVLLMKTAVVAFPAWKGKASVGQARRDDVLACSVFSSKPCSHRSAQNSSKAGWKNSSEIEKSRSMLLKKQLPKAGDVLQDGE